MIEALALFALSFTSNERIDIMTSDFELLSGSVGSVDACRVHIRVSRSSKVDENFGSSNNELPPFKDSWSKTFNSESLSKMVGEVRSTEDNRSRRCAMFGALSLKLAAMSEVVSSRERIISSSFRNGKFFIISSKRSTRCKPTHQTTGRQRGAQRREEASLPVLRISFEPCTQRNEAEEARQRVTFTR